MGNKHCRFDEFSVQAITIEWNDTQIYISYDYFCPITGREQVGYYLKFQLHHHLLVNLQIFERYLINYLIVVSYLYYSLLVITSNEIVHFSLDFYAYISEKFQISKRRLSKNKNTKKHCLNKCHSKRINKFSVVLLSPWKHRGNSRFFNVFLAI